jgi:periplasmic divalent cation tolerance protein
MGYVTVPSFDIAKTICETLLEQKLIACANVLPPHTAFYKWDCEVCEEKEVAIVLKTTNDKCDAVIEAVKKLHPAECPCVVFWGIEKGSEEFLEWVKNCMK